MKKLLSLLTLSLFIFLSVQGQYIPRGMNYQAVARDKSGEILPEKEIFLRINLERDPSSSGEIYYSELHKITTNKLGLFSLVIGRGSTLSGDFNAVPWSSVEIWMAVAIKVGHDNEFTSLSDNKLLAVPYAFHAGTANELIGGYNPYTIPSLGAGNSIQTASPNPASAWTVKGNTASNPPSEFIGTGDYKDLVFKTNLLTRLIITKDGNISISNSLEIGLDLFVGRNVYLNTTSGQTINNGNATFKKYVILDNATLGSTSPSTGALTVAGGVGIGEKLNVGNDTKLGSKLEVVGDAKLDSKLEVVNDTKLDGKLDVTNATTLQSTLGVTGITTLSNKLNANGQVTVNATLANGEGDYGNYPLRVQGSQQGIAVKLSPSNPNENNNYISFWDGNGNAKGRVEGQTGLTGIARSFVNGVIGGIADDLTVASPDRDKNSTPADATSLQIFTSSYAMGAYSLTLDFVGDIIRMIVNIIGASGACISGDCDDIFWSTMDVVVGGVQLGFYIEENERNLGVAFESGGADYAEWLPKNPKENLTYGDVVGVRGGMVSKKYLTAEKFMVVSHAPVILGGMPPVEGQDNQFEKIAFMGQVPVKVVGIVHKGDYILPSGNGDGFAMAADPSSMKAADYKRIVGVAWSESNGMKMFSYINTAVGLNTNDMAGMIENMQSVLNNMQTAMKKMDPDFQPVYFGVSTNSKSQATGYSSTPPLNQQIMSGSGVSKWSTPTDATAAASVIAANQGFDFGQYAYLSELIKNPTKENGQKALTFYTNAMNKLMAMKDKKSK